MSKLFIASICLAIFGIALVFCVIYLSPVIMSIIPAGMTISSKTSHDLINQSIALITSFASLFIIFLSILTIYFEWKRDKEVKMLKELQGMERNIKNDIQDQIKGYISEKYSAEIENKINPIINIQKNWAILNLKKKQLELLRIYSILDEIKYYFYTNLDKEMEIDDVLDTWTKFCFSLSQLFKEKSNEVWTGINTLISISDNEKIYIPDRLENLFEILFLNYEIYKSDLKVLDALNKLHEKLRWKFLDKW